MKKSEAYIQGRSNAFLDIMESGPPHTPKEEYDSSVKTALCILKLALETVLTADQRESIHGSIDMLTEYLAQ